MMMSRPQPKEATDKVAPEPIVEDTAKPKTTNEAVQDLERRLAMLSPADENAPPQQQPQVKQEEPPPPAEAPAAATSTAPKGGKNALLARIMAAQEKAKAAGRKAEETSQPPPPVDLLLDDQGAAAPPPFDETLLPPPPQEEKQEAPPPPFETVEQSDPPPAFETVEEQPPTYEQMQDTAPPAPMAPAFEDLLDTQQPSLDGIEPMQAPTSTSAMEEEIMGMEGLSEEERRALIEEQRQIMAQIEQEKSANAAAIAAAAADAFDSRSAPAVAQVASDGPPRVADTSGSRTVNLGGGQEVALHGQERTRAAIADGTAILVQCVHCQNWMQVTDTATLMYCPVCSVVSPVERQSAVFTREEAMQLTADRKMAEQLQNEEYAEEEEEEEETWWGAVTNLFAAGKKPETGIPAQPPPQQVAPTHRGEIGVARPPGSPARSSGGGLVAARTGEEETITFSNSYEEREGLLLNNTNANKARVAEQKPLFSCMVDSVSSAASAVGSALTTTTLTEDAEGNVHGVDSSSLLAVTRASRNAPEEEEYQPLNGQG